MDFSDSWSIFITEQSVSNDGRQKPLFASLAQLSIDKKEPAIVKVCVIPLDASTNVASDGLFASMSSCTMSTIS
jgi:hypothetical protein